jgi:hypothetical protein
MQTRCHVATVLAVKVLRNSINGVSRLFVHTVTSYVPRVFNTQLFSRQRPKNKCVHCDCRMNMGIHKIREFLKQICPRQMQFLMLRIFAYAVTPIIRYTTQTLGLHCQSVSLKLLVRHKTSKTEINFPLSLVPGDSSIIKFVQEKPKNQDTIHVINQMHKNPLRFNRCKMVNIEKN